LTEDYYIQFAKFEIRVKEEQRAREIFKFGLEKLKDNSKLYQEYLNFEKKTGKKEEIDSLILEKRRKIY
jgi:crooked neck